MNGREKYVALILGGVVILAVLYGGYTKLLRNPARKLESKRASLLTEQADLEQKNVRLRRIRQEWIRLRNRTYHDTLSRVPNLLNERVNELARQAGLGQVPVRSSVGRSNRYFKEITCSTDGRTSLERLTNFLYLLTHDKYLHRITSLTISPPRRGEKEVGFSLQYATLWLDPNLKTKDRPARQADASLGQSIALNSPERSLYDVIARRHLFLPYVPRVERPRIVEPPRVNPPVTPPVVRPPPTNSYDRLVVVGLPGIGETAEVHVAQPGGNIVEPLKVGDKLPIGQIVMVDYRVMPMPGDPDDLSTGRVILKVDVDYWAVELGHSLGQRRILRWEDLPDQLKAKTTTENNAPTTQPAGKAGAPAAGKTVGGAQ